MTIFDRTTDVTPHPDDPASATITLDAAWSSLRGIHGGYLSAIAVRAVEPRLDGRRVRTLATSFLRPATDGPAHLAITTVRVGRSLATFEVTLSQDDRPVTVIRLTAVAEVAGVEWDHSPPLAIAPVEQCVSVPPPWSR